jgi:integrative and conjugative element protein (TIGR02256 family)
MLTQLPFGPSGAMLLLEPPLLQRLAAFRQLDGSAPEAGGILMGYRRGPHTHVTDGTVPAARDSQWRFGFFRHATHHQRVAMRKWKQSGETMDYVGEWHTHPEDDPTPSGIDLKHWREISATHSKPMVFLIVGRSTNWLGVGLEHRLERAG